MLALLSALAIAQACTAAETEAIASIELHNPGASARPVPIEIPVGRIAAPGLIDWSAVRLLCDGEEIPWLLREGRAHWKADLAAPVAQPRAEDLLCFNAAVPPGGHRRVTIARGARADAGAVSRHDGAIVVSYPTVVAELDEATGRLTGLSIHGKPLLAEPLSVTFHTLASPGYVATGAVGPGYHEMTVEPQRTGTVSHRARLVGEASSAAMTELHWIIEPDAGPAMGLTYRVYASGMVEVVADERPWNGPSPWTDHAVSWTLPIAGDAAPMPYFETRWPFYGFKDYVAAFPQAGRVWTGDGTRLAEWGDEAANGRRWRRVLLPAADMDVDAFADWVELADEGLVVVVRPVCTDLAAPPTVTGPEEAEVIAGRLREVLGAEDAMASATAIELVQTDDLEGLGLEGDGFLIREEDDGVALVSGTRFGLYQAVRAVADHLMAFGPDAGLPLIASNPVVAFRAGGFGGGNFEVDFPYGDDAEWEQALTELMDSGMNVLTCLGMWGEWKMPVTYKYMPELYSDDPEAYDESTGVLFVEADAHRDRALRLTQFIQERGGKVWLWLPIGCVPTTFSTAHPEAMAPGEVEEFWGRPKGTPCFTHPTYLAYLKALLQELTETYPLDGLMLVRDDNGKLCECERCKAFLEDSRTGQGAWEQYLIIYDTLRELGFDGAVGVYPYFDAYTAELEDQLPADLYIVGHGASLAGLTRSHELVGHMPDTWLDNLYTNFRLPSTPRLRRVLADRATFYIGGAYRGTELPWLSIGRFGWEPTSTPNSLRALWAARRFGLAATPAFVAFSDAYERLWDVSARWMAPKTWMDLSDAQRDAVVEEAETVLARCRDALDDLAAILGDAEPDWTAHVRIFPPFFEYHLQRLRHFAAIHATVAEHRDAVAELRGLPDDARQAVLDHYAEIYAYAAKYAEVARQAPGGMMAATQHLLAPYKEWMAGYDGWLDPHLVFPQFAGALSVETVAFAAGQPFTLRVELANMGVCPWIADAAQWIELDGETETLGLPTALTYDGPPIAPGERGAVELKGVAPETPGEAQITIKFSNPYRATGVIDEQQFTLRWD